MLRPLIFAMGKLLTGRRLKADKLTVKQLVVGIFYTSLSALLLVFVLVAIPGRVYACSCSAPGMSPGSLADAFEAYPYIFKATVVDMRHFSGEVDQFSWTLRVDKVWKGDVPEQIVYRSSRQYCAFRQFKKGSTYIVYATRTTMPDTENDIGISNCSPTKHDYRAEAEMSELDVLSQDYEPPFWHYRGLKRKWPH